MALGRIGGGRRRALRGRDRDEDGELRAMLHFVPWGNDGLSLDLMRQGQVGGRPA